MKHIIAAVLILMVFKGITYTFFADHIKYMAQKMADIDTLQYKMFGWLLLFTALIIWLAYLRYQFL